LGATPGTCSASASQPDLDDGRVQIAHHGIIDRVELLRAGIGANRRVVLRLEFVLQHQIGCFEVNLRAVRLLDIDRIAIDLDDDTDDVPGRVADGISNLEHLCCRDAVEWCVTIIRSGASRTALFSPGSNAEGVCHRASASGKMDEDIIRLECFHG
jgi:hypothetical protein